LLWNAFARIEQACGNSNEARNVYLVALSAVQYNQPYCDLIYFSFVDFEVENNRIDVACGIFFFVILLKKQKFWHHLLCKSLLLNLKIWPKV
jgi:hypothetical protein